MRLYLGLAVLAVVFAAFPQDLRLPDSVRPSAYAIELKVIPGEETFTGTVRIDIDIARPLKAILLHARELSITSATIEGQSVPLQVQHRGDLLELTGASGLPRGPTVLTIRYGGRISKSLTDGVFQQKYNDEWYVFTKFEPVTARRAVPCFDEPSFKARWSLTLRVPKHVKAFSNTLAATETDDPDGLRRIQFKPTKPLPSYLLAFAVGPLEVVDGGYVGSNSVPSRIIVPRGRAAETEYAASITPTLISALEQYFGTPYPFEKLDQIAIPLSGAWGAMENAGLIAYGPSFLSPKSADTETARYGRDTTMAHEMAHQWFGNMVTTAWWNDIWLNESFAEWLGNKIVRQMHPNSKLVSRPMFGRYWAMQLDQLSTARKIREPIIGPGDIASAFDSITYLKGEAVVATFENYIGEEGFRAAVRTYLKRHAWGNATSNDLLEAIRSVGFVKAASAMAGFLDQGGVPLIKNSLECSNGRATLKVSQEPLVPLGSPARANTSWQIPVCVKYSVDGKIQRECNLLTTPSKAFGLSKANACPEWLITGDDGTGYFRPLYDAPMIEAIVQRSQKGLMPHEQVTFVLAVSALLESGRMPISDALKVVEAFAEHPDNDVVRATIVMVERLHDDLPEDLAAQYAKFIRRVYGGRATKLGWIPRPDDTADDVLLRPLLVGIVARLGEDLQLAQQATNLTKKWLTDRNAVAPNLAPAVLSTAAYHGNGELFEAFRDAVKNTTIQRQRQWIIQAMRGFRQPEIARSALNLLFADGIDPREYTTLLTYPNRWMRPVVWSFILENYDRLDERLPGARGVPFSAALPLAAAGFCDTEKRGEIESFFHDRVSGTTTGVRNLRQALESVSLCIARHKAQAAEIRAALKQKAADKPVVD